MPVKRVTPDEAATLVQQGWKYVDVRSVPEFEQGHPRGAFNVPLMHQVGAGRTPNSDFTRVFTANFDKHEQIVVGCHSGARSLRAAEMLQGQGYTNIVDMRGGFAGEPGPGGTVACPGWSSLGLPVERGPEPERSYKDLAAKAS